MPQGGDGKEPQTLLEAIRHFADTDVMLSTMIEMRWPGGWRARPAAALMSDPLARAVFGNARRNTESVSFLTKWGRFSRIARFRQTSGLLRSGPLQM